MRRAESVLVSMEFTLASRSHRCGYDKRHRIDAGAARLTIRDDDEEHHYCVQCAKALLVQGADQLQMLLEGTKRLADTVRVISGRFQEPVLNKAGACVQASPR